MDDRRPPLLRHKAYGQASEFMPAKLLREARRQKSLPNGRLPRVCVLDPDGDIVANLVARGQAQPNPFWACYHTSMYNFSGTVSSVGLSARLSAHHLPFWWPRSYLPRAASCSFT